MIDPETKWLLRSIRNELSDKLPSVRQYFAGLAMNAIIQWDNEDNMTELEIAKAAVRQADLLIKELEK